MVPELSSLRTHLGGLPGLSQGYPCVTAKADGEYNGALSLQDFFANFRGCGVNVLAGWQGVQALYGHRELYTECRVATGGSEVCPSIPS